jgi:hypothetical protein
VTTILLIILAWNLAPLVLLAALPLPAPHKRRAALSLLQAAGKGLMVLLPDLLAPVVVPIALLQTKREDEHLPRWARWWDNDVSINGDWPQYLDPAYAGDTYYAPGHHPRSFWARYVWLGWRNRASWLSQRLGHRWKVAEYHDAQSWGDPLTGGDHEGWAVHRRGRVYQLYAIKRLGRLNLRINWGHKVWAGAGDGRPVANIVNITFSLKRAKGVA